MPKSRKHTTRITKKIVTKAALNSLAKELTEKLEWATKIIQTQQGEIDRLMKLNDKLTSILDQFSRKD